jgi:hypothetical protein
MKLTDIRIRSLPSPKNGQKTYWDALPGFGVRVSQGGTKTFVLVCGQDRQRITIGRFPVLSLSDARGEAKRILAERTLGKTRPTKVHWDDAVERYLDACRAKNNRPRTIADYKRLLARHFPFKRHPLAEITYEDIERKLGRIKAPSERNHALVAVKIFLGWCQKPPRRYIPTNPCEGMAPTKRPHRKKVLTQDELRAVLSSALNGTGTLCRIVALLVLTLQRRGEIGQLRWSWISKSAQAITLPGTVCYSACNFDPLMGGIGVQN